MVLSSTLLLFVRRVSQQERRLATPLTLETTMPQYAAIIYSPDVDWSLPEHGATIAEYSAFGQAAAAVIRGGAALYPTPTATTVRVTGGKGGEVVTTDGPYAETKEALTGFFLIEADDLDSAVEIAAKIPAAWDGTGAVEVRPVIPMLG
jgi:hypothetical protein